jgi:hypothetical protein
MQPKLANGETPNGRHPTSPVESPKLTETLRQLRSQTPSEALGLAGRNGLFKASIQAGLIIGVLFALLTVGPYFYEKSKAGAKNEDAAPAEKPEGDKVASPTSPPRPSTPTPTDSSSKQPTTPSTGGKMDPKDDLLGKLGESGTKSGSPKLKDPFKAGGGDDDLLKDIK